MLSIRINSISLLSKIPALAAGLLLFVQCGYAGTPSLESGFHQMYNLDFQSAHKTFEEWQQLYPDDPLGAASNAAAYLFAEFERMHILDFDLFTDKNGLDEIKKVSPDPQIKAAFEGELAKADAIAAKVLAQSSGDCNALFAKLLADGLRGNYAALVEKQKRTGLDFLKSSRTVAEKLINIDPEYNDAYLAVGIENYILGLRSAPTRWILHLSGSQTNKDKGLANLKITAEKGRYLAPYARVLLAIAALREQDRETARRLLTDLVREFPENRFYQAELAHLHS